MYSQLGVVFSLNVNVNEETISVLHPDPVKTVSIGVGYRTLIHC